MDKTTWFWSEGVVREKEWFGGFGGLLTEVKQWVGSKGKGGLGLVNFWAWVGYWCNRVWIGLVFLVLGLIWVRFGFNYTRTFFVI